MTTLQTRLHRALETRELDNLGFHEFLDERDALLTLLDIYALSLAPLETRALAGLASAARIAPKDTFGETFGAAGPFGVIAGLAAVKPGCAFLVLDVCASGHVAALVARRGVG